MTLDIIMDNNDFDELMKRVKARESTINIHEPYSKVSGRKPDFEVEYELDIDPALEEVRPGQGMRCDFLYEGDNPVTDGIHMIWPEFLDQDGNVITDKAVVLGLKGKATMWIGMHESRVKTHQSRIKVGTKGFWVIGSKKLAKVTVTKILGLFENKQSN